MNPVTSIGFASRPVGRLSSSLDAASLRSGFRAEVGSDMCVRGRVREAKLEGGVGLALSASSGTGGKAAISNRQL